MKAARILAAIAALLLCLSASAQTIHLMGDSTCADKDLSNGNLERGWGMQFANFLDDGIKVINYAVNGRSTKSFITLGHWDKVKAAIKPGDYVFIQFGHNDEKETDPVRYAPAWGLYQDNLRMYCRTVREMGATPVLLTPLLRRLFVDGEPDMTNHGDYPAAMRQVAAEMGVELLDITEISAEWLRSLVDEASRPYFMWIPKGVYAFCPEGKEDNTHTKANGARAVAGLVCDAIRQSSLDELKRHLLASPPDIVVAEDGRGDYLTLQEAVDALPDRTDDSIITIRVKGEAQRVVIPAGRQRFIVKYDSEPLSLRMVRSEMTRCPDGTLLDFCEGALNWNYTPGLEMKAFLDVRDAYGGDDILQYVDDWYDLCIGNDGHVKYYYTGDYSVDKVCPARTMYQLYDDTGKVKYRQAVDSVMARLATHPRTSEGAFWHKSVYPYQVWLDGVYMAEPFQAEYAVRYAQDKEAAWAEIINEFTVAARHTYDPVTRLYRHAWDETRSMFWCDPETGQSKHCWGRALGWYCMGLVDVLDRIPEGVGGRGQLLEILRGIVDVLPTFADPETGMWYQVLDCPGREGNYLEATCSAMFSYTLLKGVRLGLLDASLEDYARKVYDGLVRTFISEDDNGLLNINQCCSVGGLGGDARRTGDYDYYLSEPIRANDPKGVGPFIWASLEMERR